MNRRALLAAGAGLTVVARARAALPAHAAWQPAGMNGLAVRRLHADTMNPGVLYAGAQGVPASGVGRTALFKSLDAGRSWFALERGLPGGFVPTALAISPADGRLVLAGGAEGLFRSTDGGAAWNAVSGRFPPITA